MAQYSNLFVVLMGIGTVFFGLVCIIFLTAIMGKVLKTGAVPAAAKAPVAVPAAAPAAPAKPQGMQPEILAVISAVLSEEVGIPSHGVNITNIKKL